MLYPFGYTRRNQYQMLSEVVRDMPFEPFSIDHQVDQHKCYQLSLDSRFPLEVKLYSYLNSDKLRFNWHERLEVNVSVKGRGRFRMGERILNFSTGDIIVVDNLTLHGLLDYEGSMRKAAVITFMPDLICNPVSYPCDSIYLRPFFSRQSGLDPVLRPCHPIWEEVDRALAKVVESYYSGKEQGYQAGCKAYMLQALYGLARHFGLTEPNMSEVHNNMHQSVQFGRLREFLRENYSTHITVRAAASMVGVNEFRFMKFFKRATGMTFVDYVNHLRLSNAYSLLITTDRSIADIAVSVGFADQSYFDRCFRKHYSQTPRDARRMAGLCKVAD